MTHALMRLSMNPEVIQISPTGDTLGLVDSITRM